MSASSDPASQNDDESGRPSRSTRTKQKQNNSALSEPASHDDDEGLVVSTMHLPRGDALAGTRELLLKSVCGSRGKDAARVLLVGDMNAKDEEIRDVSKHLMLREARYSGATWGTRDNLFYEDMKGGGAGLRLDRVLFGKEVWAETHVIGQMKQPMDQQTA